jgi:hypothetical protein
MAKIVRAFGSLRLLLLATAVVLSSLAMFPAAPATAGVVCGAPWEYYGCCYSSTRVTEKQRQTCCDNGYCYDNYRCTSYACPV